ncbi:SDR family NAD(P)-dependent oxidoreductase [Nocardia barduliensis]|uniref:SDR family NAD(P)-dependent oxidoreductase n=1 Tax=Nocardia barduliensis TaxID=2736643 RepID=UPI001573D321|nr:SDR family oxidoreductase [Nocardia barduliensis]
MDELTGLAALVTGGASGIGAATAAELRRRGARVAVLDRDISAAAPDVPALRCDLTDAAAVETAVAHIVAELGGLDIVVNNAGIGATGDITANDDDEWHRVYDVNVVAIARVMRAALPHLRRSPNASVVNLCSAVAFVGVRSRALYSATKGAVAALTLAMAADHVADGIRVNAVAPGTVDSPWVGQLLSGTDSPDEAAAALRARQPIGRLVTTDEVAVAVAGLASPGAGSTTGTVLRVDGGMSTLRV